MIERQSHADSGFGVSIVFSTVIHLAVFLLLFWYGSQAVQMTKEETYYVDLVNLPVSDPRGGSPSQTGNDTPAPLPPVPGEMALPKAPQKSVPLKQPVKPPAKAAESASEFSERMARLEKKQEAQQEEEAFARLREKVKGSGSGRAGTPAGGGKEAGSDYVTYIQSRLKDAFGKNMSRTSERPEMVVRLFIDTNGKISHKKTESSTNDRAFEISVLRTIDIASEKFPPPPNRKMFEGVFVFKREGISQNKP